MNPTDPAPADSAPSEPAPAGTGPLARALATRGGSAAAEAPFVIEHREALIYMLCEAAELEHGIMCQYLYAAFSLKQSADEGLDADGLALVQSWRRTLGQIAGQEMLLHLALVHNLLAAIGGPPHFGRPNLPQPARHYPAGVNLELRPFDREAVQHFLFLERPEGMALEDAAGSVHADHLAGPPVGRADIVPQGQDFATVGHLYRSIESGLDQLAAKYGEDGLFIGPPRAQAIAEHFQLPELVPVTDLASAHRAIDTILEQGEGVSGAWQAAHFGRFVEMQDELTARRAADPSFDPARPVLVANVRPPHRDADLPLITDPLTARVADVFNVGYEVLLQLMTRYFAHTDETDEQLKLLADAGFTVMFGVLRPLGELLTALPVGPEHPGRTAGATFELFYEADYLVPHMRAAWLVISERLREAATCCAALAAESASLAATLAPVERTFAELSARLSAAVA